MKQVSANSCWPDNSPVDWKTAKMFSCQSDIIAQRMRNLTRRSVTCDHATPYLLQAVPCPRGVPGFLSLSPALGHFWLTASEIAPFFFFFFALDTVWSSRQSHWLTTVPRKTSPWPDGCSISERATRCVWIVSLQLWTLQAFDVLETAWTLTGKGGKRVGGFVLVLIWGDLSSPCLEQRTRM